MSSIDNQDYNIQRPRWPSKERFFSPLKMLKGGHFTQHGEGGEFADGTKAGTAGKRRNWGRRNNLLTRTFVSPQVYSGVPLLPPLTKMISFTATPQKIETP
ncbi:hypothetical protein SKAU_G00420960 [Synaphobranchus kaupii]|uniref:Uncharacterized protein n=1 Tax=Synaphobranchus kaupii TaxID=118154 RepID=A0A9Q1E6M1_SYNKA|nr:hypothetical protein SKAU_G00420960 [Synaphobranchus kaupii]